MIRLAGGSERRHSLLAVAADVAPRHNDPPRSEAHRTAAAYLVVKASVAVPYEKLNVKFNESDPVVDREPTT